ncbi:MAG TPA: ABC transporter ATP-binding protein [Devosia sp.]|nr:ABC transporter ATP-binding protein [Devosia sp.]
MSVLSIRGLAKRYGATQALADFDLDVAGGSRVAIVGPSGSGKTTLLRLIAGFESPDAGEIKLDGQTLATAEAGVPAHRRNVGLVMQEGALFPHLSILDNIRFGITDRADGEAEALKLMDLVELDRAMANRSPHQLSGGQQQRVALARALARKPRLMLLDEPFSALDTELREQLRRATADILSRANVATILVTHDRDEAMGFADQLVVLRNGRLAQAGVPRALYLAPADEGVASFLGAAIVLDAEVSDGHAATMLGNLPLAAAHQAPGRARVLVRPEQLQLAHAGEGGAWRLVSALCVGPTAHVTVAGPAETTISFDTTTVGLPEPGRPVVLSVSGPAHRFA